MPHLFNDAIGTSFLGEVKEYDKKNNLSNFLGKNLP